MQANQNTQANGFHSEILNSISEPLIVIDKNFTIDYVNQTALADTQINALGKTCYKVFHERETPCEPCPCMDVFNQGKPFRKIKTFDRNGEVTSKELCAYPIFGQNGEISHAIEIVRDVLQTQKKETDLFSHPGGFQLKKNGFLPDQIEETSFCGMIGRSKKMRALFQMIRLVAPSSATVLIYGESGTGKERVAQAIHQMSSRRQHPFVAIDCGALPEALLESELFGHVKGAFTGAISHKKGLFEEAEGGTLFLDEISDTSLVFQSKLLRVLQEGEARPVGGNRSIKVDVRMIAATNRSLKEGIAKKTFREDLYYRLAVMPIMIPPLRGRLDDIPLLVEHFIQRYTQKNGKGLMHLSKEASEVLLRMPWKGNVRELENVIERGVLVSQQQEIALESLLIEEEVTSLGYAPSTSLFSATQEVMSKVERERIIESLQECKGNKSKAARLLGISRASFYNKLKRYEIPISL